MTDIIGYALIIIGILFDIFGCIGLVRFIALALVAPVALIMATPTNSRIVPSVTHFVEACRRL